VTIDPTEGPMVKRVMEIRAEARRPEEWDSRGYEVSEGGGPISYLDGIVFYRALYQGGVVDARGVQRTVYVIVREKIEPRLSNAFAFGRSDYETRGERALIRALDAARAYHKTKRPSAREHHLEWYRKHASDVQDGFPYVSETLWQLLDEEPEIVLQDVHLANIGLSVVDWGDDVRSPGTVIIHDLGHTPTAPAGAIPEL
jgi:hypothetical protein